MCVYLGRPYTSGVQSPNLISNYYWSQLPTDFTVKPVESVNEGPQKMVAEQKVLVTQDTSNPEEERGIKVGIGVKLDVPRVGELYVYAGYDV